MRGYNQNQHIFIARKSKNKTMVYFGYYRSNSPGTFFSHLLLWDTHRFTFSCKKHYSELSCTLHLVSPCDNVMYQYSKISHPRSWHWWIYQPYSNSNHFTSCTHLCGDLLLIATIYWALLWSSSSSQKPTYRWRKWGKEESEDLNLHHLTLKAELFILHYRYVTSTCVFDSFQKFHI